MLAFVCIYYVQTEEDTSDALFFNNDAMLQYIRGRKSRLSALVDLITSPTAVDYEMFGQPFMSALSTQDTVVTTRCSCVDLRGRACASRFDDEPVLQIDRPINNPSYSLMITQLKSKYEVKSGNVRI